MKIRTSDGTIEFASGSVSHDTSRTSFLASSLGHGADVVVENAPYVTYRIRPEPGIGATLLFEQQRLRNVGWAIILPGEAEDDWSVESEMRRKRLHDDWLRKELGVPPYRFSWGEIVSEFDAKGVSSAIILAYGP